MINLGIAFLEAENMPEINKNEVVRYLGYRGINRVDETVEKIIDDCIREMQEKVEPKKVYRTFPIEWEEDGGCTFAGIQIKSGNLLKNLKGCSEIVMLAVTLGSVPDMLVRRAEVRDMMKAYTFQAVGAALAEAYIDEVNDQIKSEAAARGLFARPRFSPGYGDFPLEVQRDFERILEMSKNIGVTLSDSLLMTPTKSITAVIGLSDKDANCTRAGCEECNMRNTCEYSRA